jgi:sulfur carrier protein
VPVQYKAGIHCAPSGGATHRNQVRTAHICSMGETGMVLLVNGQPHNLAGEGRIADLLREVGCDPGRTALMLNGEVVRRDAWDGVRLQENDRVELLVFAGGG